MLLNKYWLETKSRFFLGVLFISAVTLFFVLGQPWILEQWAKDERLHPELESAPWVLVAKKDYMFFIWRFLYNYLLQVTWVMFTIMLALGGLTHEHEKGSHLFTLSLPVTRTSLFMQRTAIGFVEAVVLALLPAILVPLGSAVIGQDYSLVSGINHSLLFIAGGIVFYALGVLINTTIRTEAVSFFVALGVVIVFYFLFQPYSEGMTKPLMLKLIDLPGLMAGDKHGNLVMGAPFASLFACFFIAAALIYVSYLINRKRDF